MESTESKEKKNICARVPMKLAVALATRLSTDQIDQTIFMEKAIHWYLGTDPPTPEEAETRLALEVLAILREDADTNKHWKILHDSIIKAAKQRLRGKE